MRKPTASQVRVIIVFVILALMFSLPYLATYLAIVGTHVYTSLRLWPHSDVPVISDIAGWPYQKNLRLTDLKVEVVDAPLNLFNDQALVRFQLEGTISYEKGRRPYVESVQLSQRRTGDASGEPCGDLQLVPVIGIREEPNYAGDTLAFNVKVEQVVHALDWGPSKFIVTAGDQESEFALHHPK